HYPSPFQSGGCPKSSAVQLQPIETTSIVLSILYVPLVRKFLDESLLRPRLHAACFAPEFPRRVEHPCGGERAWIGGIDAVVKPLLRGVLVGKILLAGLPHAVRHHEAVTLPFEATIQHPAQDRRMFRHKLA